MNGSVRTIARNAAVLMSSQLTTWTLTLLLTIFLPRFLGPAGMGQMLVATSIWAVVGVLIGFGMDTLLIKEIARNHDQAKQLLGASLTLRTVLDVVAWVGIAVYLSFADYSIEIIGITILLGISALVWQYGNAFQAMLQGLEAMHYVSVAGIVGKVVYTVGCLLMIVSGASIYLIAAMDILSALAVLITLATFAKRRYQIGFHFRRVDYVSMLRASAPYLVAAFASIAYGRIDTLILSFLVDETTLGWYGTAMQLTGTLIFIPVVLTTAVFPAMTRMYINDGSSENMRLAVRKNLDLMTIASIPIGFGIVIVSDQIIRLIFGDQFAPAGPVLAIMGLVVILMYQNILFGSLMTAIDRQNIWTVVMLVCTAITIPLDILLVPWCTQVFGDGALGGALSYAITELAMVAVGLLMLPRGWLNWWNVYTLIGTVVAGGVMIAATWWFRETFIAVPIVLGAVVYIGMVLLLRIVPPEDIALVRSMIGEMISRRRPGAATSSHGIEDVSIPQ